MTWLTVTVIAALFALPALALEIAGTPRVLDGDTVEVAGTRIRIHGIDAPETDQVCLDGRGGRWSCGMKAKAMLEQRIGGQALACAGLEADRYGRAIATCKDARGDVGRWMVATGWALAFVRYSRVYEREEAEARKVRAGLWRGAFIAPWDWRSRSKASQILGAAAVPVGAQAILLGTAPASDAPNPHCAIKGNVNRSGACIYHRPGQRYYDKVKMTGAKGKRWFCSPAEAEAAGCRAAKI